MIWCSPIIFLCLNYLLFFFKLLERLVYNSRIVFINSNRVLYEYRFGFQAGKSIHFAIVLLTDKITKSLDHGECHIVFF